MGPPAFELVQTGESFLGQTLWYVFDVATFGAFEKKHNTTKKAQPVKIVNQTIVKTVTVNQTKEPQPAKNV